MFSALDAMGLIQPIKLDVALSRLMSPDREGRRTTAEAVTKALEPGVRTRGYIYNTIAQDKATDDRLRTWVETPAGDFPFQEWFVARGHRDEVDSVRFEGDARPAPGVLEALAGADAIVIAPSNPIVSVQPILDAQ